MLYDDHVQYILDQPFEHEPGTAWVYNTAACHLLSPILTQATGLTEESYGRQHLPPLYGSGYGYLWWVGNARGHDFFFANGYAGQLIVVVPQQELVIVAQSALREGREANDDQWVAVYQLVVNRVLGAVEG